MNHKDLETWKRSIAFVRKLYQYTDLLPESEKFGLRNQMRRSAVSIPSNIAEGCAKNSNPEAIRYLYVSLGSLSELETQLLIAEELFDLDSRPLIEELTEVRRLILGLRNYLSKQVQKQRN